MAGIGGFGNNNYNKYNLNISKNVNVNKNVNANKNAPLNLNNNVKADGFVKVGGSNLNVGGQPQMTTMGAKTNSWGDRFRESYLRWRDDFASMENPNQPYGGSAGLTDVLGAAIFAFFEATFGGGR